MCSFSIRHGAGRRRESTIIPNCVPLLIEFNEVLLHYPNSHFPTTGCGGGPDPDFRYTHIHAHSFVHIYAHSSRVYTLHNVILAYHPLVCGMVLLGRRCAVAADARQNLTVPILYVFVQLKIMHTFITPAWRCKDVHCAYTIFLSSLLLFTLFY